LLAPSAIDDQTGYRYYDADKVEVARLIRSLRDLEFSLPEIEKILRDCGRDSDLLSHLERQKKSLAAKAQHYRHVEKRLDQMIKDHSQERTFMNSSAFVAEEKAVPSIEVAGVRMKGRYSDCGRGFAQIGRKLGRYLGGPCFLLHYDDEYKEDDADFEACFPLRAGGAKKAHAKNSASGISIHLLAGGRCVSLLHKGPYEQLGPSYEKILGYIKSKGYEIELPTRELYLKGPGMIFKGNPKKYLTEIQMLVKE
jgi:effector-binding domain-containing protein